MRSLSIRPNRPAILGGSFIPILILWIWLAGGCASSATLQANEPLSLALKSSWPQASSDLAADPEALFGHLPNGVSYVLKENRTPRDRVSMHLFLRSGSLHEYDSEQGMAHFLEHMVFNGSENFPPGEMVKFFQRIGMQFGPDANAHTSFAQTVYDVILPKGDMKSMGEGLLVLRDYAQGALLLEEELQRERNVILSEMRARDSAEFRTFKSVLGFEAPGTLLPNRLPIGEEAVLRQIDADMMRAFYDAWYRPERMTLVIVGDFKPGEALELLKAQFGDLQPRSEMRESPKFGSFDHQGLKAFYHHEKDVGGTRVSIETVVHEAQPADSIQWREQSLLADLANTMLQNRLNRLLQQSDGVLNSASIGSGYYLQEIRFAEISADTKPENWRSALGVLETELRKALKHGFTEAELSRVKKEISAQLRRQVEESQTRDSNILARHIMGSLSSQRVFQSPQQRLALLEPILAEATLDKVNEILRWSWAPDHRLIIVTGNADLTDQGVSPEDAIIAAYTQSGKVAVTASTGPQAAQFPYLPDPEQGGSIASRNTRPMDIEHVTFANGVNLLLKPTPFKANEVLVTLSFGGGLAAQPSDRPGLAEMTREVINNSGFGALDKFELEEAMAGSTASIALEVREDMFVVKGDAASGEIPVLFQLLYAFLNDPGYRGEARDLALKRYAQRYQTLLSNVDGVMQAKGQRFLAGGDTRFGMPEWHDFEKRTLEEVKAWFGQQLHHEPLEIAVVGDFNKESIIELTSRYFGSLPPRSAQATYNEMPGPRFPKGETETLTAESVIPKTLLVVAYPTDDFWDIQRTRRLNLLADVISERLRIRIREALGAVYSPFAFNRSYRSFDGYGVLQIHLNVDPASAATLEEEVQEIVRRTAQEGIEADEFRRVLDPTLTGIKDLRQTNTYWLNSVLAGASRHPEQLEWSRTMEQDYASITIAEITALARRYLIVDNSAVIVAAPRAVLPAQADTPQTSAIP
jgi:zinc protease